MIKTVIYIIIAMLYIFLGNTLIKGMPLIYRYKKKEAFNYLELSTVLDKFKSLFTKYGMCLVYDIFLILMPFIVFYKHKIELRTFDICIIMLYFFASRSLYCLIYHYKCVVTNELLIVKLEEMHQIQKKEEKNIAESA